MRLIGRGQEKYARMVTGEDFLEEDASKERGFV